MKILNIIFVITVIAINLLVSNGFLSHQQKLPIHLHFSGRTQQPKVASLAIDKILKHPNCSEQNVLVQHRRSIANVQTMGLFGLGGAEIAIVVAAAAFIIGPQQLGNMMGSVTGKVKGDLPDELRKIPQEFQKGFEESTENSRARNAKMMESPPDENVQKK